jgi:ribosomal protein L37AE/L43A
MENCETCYGDNLLVVQATILRTIDDVSIWLCDKCNDKYRGNGWVHHFRFYHKLHEISKNGMCEKIKSEHCK